MLIPPSPQAATTAPAAADPSAVIADLQAQLAAAHAAQAATPAPEPAKPPRPLPKVMDLVTYTYEHSGRQGVLITRRGLVVAVDAEKRRALVNWLPDATADVIVDDLDT